MDVEWVDYQWPPNSMNDSIVSNPPVLYLKVDIQSALIIGWSGFIIFLLQFVPDQLSVLNTLRIKQI
jgi:hypothetical protein